MTGNMGNHHENERMPLLQQLPPMPTVLNEEEEGASGEVVCDNHPHRKRVLLKRSFVLLLILSMLSAITFYSVKLYSNIETTVNESLEMTVRDIGFDGIDSEDNSINLTLSVDASLNYTNTKLDAVTQKYLIWNSYLVNNLNVDLDGINITINTDELSSPIDSVGLVKVEPFNLKIYQGVTDHLNLKINIKPDSKAIFKVLKDVIMNKKIIQLNSEFLLKIRVGYLRIPIKNMNLKFDNILIDPSDLINELYDHHLQLQDLKISKDEFESSISVMSPHEDQLLTKYISYVPSIPNHIYANLLMEGCDEIFNLMEFKVEGLSGFMVHTDDNNLTITSPNSLPSRFFEKCDNGTKFSPLTNLIHSLIYHDPISNFSINSSDKNKKLFPIWFNQEILDNVAISYHIPSLSSMLLQISSTTTTGSIIQNVSIANLQLNVDNGIDKPQLSSGEIKFDIFIPLAIDLQDLKISKLKGLVDLKYEGVKFGYMDIDEWLQCQTQDASSVCHLKQNDIIVTNAQLYGMLIGDYLMGVDLQIEVVFVVDALVNWSLVYDRPFEINGLRGSGRGGL